MMTQKQNTPNAGSSTRLITYGGFFAFLLFGFADNLKGPTIPALLKDLNFNYAQGGTIFFGAYLGFLIATFITGPLSDVAGKKAIILIAATCLLFGIGGYSSFSSFWLLTAAMTVFGLGLGSLEVGGNLLIVDLHPQDKGRYLNLLSFFHGVGSMLAPLYAGRLLAAEISWRRIYQSGLILVILLGVYFILVKYPQTGSSGNNKLDLKKAGKSAFTPEMVIFYVLMAMYVAAEIGIGSWLVEFLQKAKGQSVLRSSFFLSLFFGGMTVGRFVGSFFVERIGYLRIMLYVSISSVVCLALGTFAPPALAFFLPLTGLFFSIMFPTITAAVSDLHTENMGTILGLLFTFAGVGGMLGPWIMGFLSDWGGIGMGFGMILVFCIAMCAALLLLMRRRQ